MAVHYNTSNPTIRKWLIAYGIDRKDHLQASREANSRHLPDDYEKPKKPKKPKKEKLIYPTYEELYQKYVVELLSLVEIGKLYNFSNVTAKKLCVRYGIPIRTQKENQAIVKANVNAPTKDQLYDLYIVQKLNRHQISDLLGIAPKSIFKYLNRYGIQRRPTEEVHKLRRRKCPNVDEMRDLHLNKHYSLSKLAEHYKTTPGVVSRWMVENSIDIRTRGDILSSRYSFPIPDDLPEKYKTNTAQQLSKIYNVSDITINNWLRKLDIPIRYDRSGTSGEEVDFRNWLNSLGFNFISDRIQLNGRELDCFDKNLNIAFEYCGLYFHNEMKKQKFYHYKKYEDCKNLNIKLYTIFSDEWLNRQDQVKGYIESQLGIYNTRIYGRNCIVKYVDKKEAKDFCEKYHIQGAPRSIVYSIGLYHKDQLVSIMTISRHHRNNSGPLVLSRLCFSRGITIVGGTSKMLRLVKDDIITWSDNRWTDGRVYQSCGFAKDAELGVDCTYTKNFVDRVSKQSLKSKDDTGYLKIWDCGKVRWSYKHSQGTLQ